MDGEEIVIAKANHPVVKLVLLESERKKRRLGTAAELIEMAEDFDEPLEDFKDYV